MTAVDLVGLDVQTLSDQLSLELGRKEAISRDTIARVGTSGHVSKGTGRQSRARPAGRRASRLLPQRLRHVVEEELERVERGFGVTSLGERLLAEGLVVTDVLPPRSGRLAWGGTIAFALRRGR
jgi:hypothetical protein